MVVSAFCDSIRIPSDAVGVNKLYRFFLIPELSLGDSSRITTKTSCEAARMGVRHVRIEICISLCVLLCFCRKYRKRYFRNNDKSTLRSAAHGCAPCAHENLYFLMRTFVLWSPFSVTFLSHRALPTHKLVSYLWQRKVTFHNGKAV